MGVVSRGGGVVFQGGGFPGGVFQGESSFPSNALFSRGLVFKGGGEAVFQGNAAVFLGVHI